MAAVKILSDGTIPLSRISNPQLS